LGEREDGRGRKLGDEGAEEEALGIERAMKRFLEGL